MHQVYVVDALRTPIGRYGGALAAVRPDDLAATAISSLIERSSLDPEVVDEVLLGCANQAGEDNRNIARMATLLAGLPDRVPAMTLNRLCASGLDAVNDGWRRIALGEADCIIAGGVESMSRAPWSVPKPDRLPAGANTMYDTALGWRYPNERLAARFPLENMGETAENLAERYALDRPAQDAWALRSHRLALAAQAAGDFGPELIPVTVKKRKETKNVEQDEGPRADSSPEGLARLRPAFRPGGTVTAGNSSTLNDGAAALLLMSEAALLRSGREPLGRICGVAQAGVDPRVMGIGPVPAVERLLSRLGWTWQDVDLVELNEAFAAQTLAVLSHWSIDPTQVNVSGGAIALGHPLGASGARIAATLLWSLRRLNLRRGIAALCVGVGQGVATAFERP